MITGAINQQLNVFSTYLVLDNGNIASLDPIYQEFNQNIDEDNKNTSFEFRV